MMNEQMPTWAVALEGRLGSRFDDLGTRFDGLDTRFDGIETRSDGLETRFDGLETRFDGIETRFDGIETRFDGIETRFDGLETRLDGFETRDEADAREHHLLTELSKAIADSEARLTRRLDELHDDLRVNMARADLAHTKIDADRAEVATLRRELVGLYRRLQDIEHRLFKGDPKQPDPAP